MRGRRNHCTAGICDSFPGRFRFHLEVLAGATVEDRAGAAFAVEPGCRPITVPFAKAERGGRFAGSHDPSSSRVRARSAKAARVDSLAALASVEGTSTTRRRRDTAKPDNVKRFTSLYNGQPGT